MKQRNHVPRGDRRAEQRSALVSAFMERLQQAEQDETEKKEQEAASHAEGVASVEYPASIVTTAQEIEHNAARIGELYDEFLPERGLGQAFSTTLTEVATVLEQRAQEPRSELYFNALSELKLLSEVDRLFIEQDFAHVEVLPFVDQDGQSQVIRAGLEGITIPMRATGTFPEGKNRGEDYEVEATFATWRFDPTGIRLEIEYQDPVTKVPRTVQARMDFHYRKHPKFGDHKQAALDLDGGYLKQAIRTSRELGNDYHRYQHLDPLINSEKDFEDIRSRRLAHAGRVVAASNATKKSSVQA
jgi:hypothetical protein